MNTFVIQVEPASWGTNYDGHNVLINGKQAFHRPYDGSYSDAVEAEVAEALGELLREKLGLKKEAPEEEDGW